MDSNTTLIAGTAVTPKHPLPTKVVGATLCIVGNVLISISINVQKHAHNQLAGTDKLYLKSYVWWIGKGCALFI